MPPYVSLQEFNLFHAIDRELYARLVIDFRRDLSQSMVVLAFWMWLEQVTLKDVVKKIQELSDNLVNALADEAIVILKFINTLELPSSSEIGDIPLTQTLLQQDIPLQFFLERRLDAFRGISKRVNEVCGRSFKDIIQVVMGNTIQPVVEPQGGTNIVGPGVVHQSGINPASGRVLLLPSGEIVPIWREEPHPRDVEIRVGEPNNGEIVSIWREEPHPRNLAIRVGETSNTQGVGGNQNVGMVPPTLYGFPIVPYGIPAPSNMMMINEAPNMNEQLPNPNPHASTVEQSNLEEQRVQEFYWNGNQNRIAPPSHNLGEVVEIHDDSRTIFVTFSKGYPVSKHELYNHITRNYGDCIEAIYMQDVRPDEQALYARVVFRSADAIFAILGSQDRAKFSINGKHMWARRFVSKNPGLQLL